MSSYVCDVFEAALLRHLRLRRRVARSPDIGPILLRACQAAIESEGVVIQIVEGELARPPLSIVQEVGGALDATLSIIVEERVRVLDQKAQADCGHFVLELKLHVEFDCVTAEADIVRWIGFISKGEPEAKLPRVEFNRPFDVPRAKNWVGFFEHYG